MQVLKLRGKSHKGKNRVKEHGELWLVLRWEFGHGVLIQPAALRIDGSNRHYCRWVSAPVFDGMLDRHFNVEILQ